MGREIKPRPGKRIWNNHTAPFYLHIPFIAVFIRESFLNSGLTPINLHFVYFSSVYFLGYFSVKPVCDIKECEYVLWVGNKMTRLLGEPQITPHAL